MEDNNNGGSGDNFVNFGDNNREVRVPRGNWRPFVVNEGWIDEGELMTTFSGDETMPTRGRNAVRLAEIDGRRTFGTRFPSIEGESSNASAAMEDVLETEDIDHDPYHKRAKVIAGLAECNFDSRMSLNAGASGSSSAKRSFGFGNPSTVRSESEGRDEVTKDYSDIYSDSEDMNFDLTDDLLHLVFSFLSQVDLARSASVCKQWSVASAHEDFWRRWDLENLNISAGQFERLCHRYPNVIEVNVFGAPSNNSLATKALTTLRNLEILTIGKGHIGDTFFNALKDRDRLRSLTISDATLGSNHTHDIQLSNGRLLDLKIIKCRVMRLSIRCPHLTTLSLKRSNMSQVQLQTPFLRVLDLASCYKLVDVSIRAAAISCPLLYSLDISNCPYATDETLRDVTHHCVNLQYLNASYCPSIALDSVHLHMLTVLKLHSCESITSASMAAIDGSPMLEVLEMDNCNCLTSVSLHLPCLRSISLVHCRKFVDIHLQSNMLSSISVSNCAALECISISSQSLQRLALQKQEKLTTLVLECESLLELDLSDCESLSDSVCELFNDDGGCPNLKSLVLDNCESLSAMHLCHSSLVSLSLVGCYAITYLELNCPRLEQLRLDGCDHLESAFFEPVALRSLNLGICPRLSVLNIEAPCMVALDLKGCGVLSETSIVCPLLTSFDASFCGQLNDDFLPATTVSCPMIESLVLMSCQSISSGSLHALRALQNLTTLDLSHTFLMNLDPIFNHCTRLKVLKLQACKYLADSSLEPLYKQGALPALEELDLSYGTLCKAAMDDLLMHCTHLTRLSLNGCINMHDLCWGSTNVYNSPRFLPSESAREPAKPSNWLLQTLNAVGCPKIRKVMIPQATCLFHLTTLNLSLSINLKQVDIACFNLVFLNLSNCYSLEILKLGCPKLATLFLQSCNMDEQGVESALSQCTTLETLDFRSCPKICATSVEKFRAACPSLRRILSSHPEPIS